MIFRKWVIIMMAMCIYSLDVWAQKEASNSTLVSEIIHQLGKMSGYEYKYYLKATFPDKHSETLDGDVYVNVEDKFMYNSNDAQTVIYTSNDYYKADHRKKNVVVLDLNKYYKKGKKEEMDKNLFGNGYFNSFIDSTVMKYAFLKDFSVKGDSVHISLTFPKGFYIKYIDLLYDQKLKLPIDINVSAFYPYRSGDPKFKNTGTTQTMSCNGYTYQVEKSKYKTSNYFIVSNKHVVLKKYNKYKLITEL